MSKEIGIHFGALAEPLYQQLLTQKIKKMPDNINLLQELADAVTLLAIHDVIPDSVKHKAHSKLMRMITKSLKEM